jgi:hypothetical protein
MSYQSTVMFGVATTALPRSRSEVCACTGRSAQAAVRGPEDAG